MADYNHNRWMSDQTSVTDFYVDQANKWLTLQNQFPPYPLQHIFFRTELEDDFEYIFRIGKVPGSTNVETYIDLIADTPDGTNVGRIQYTYTPGSGLCQTDWGFDATANISFVDFRFLKSGSDINLYHKVEGIGPWVLEPITLTCSSNFLYFKFTTKGNNQGYLATCQFGYGCPDIWVEEIDEWFWSGSTNFTWDGSKWVNPGGIGTLTANDNIFYGFRPYQARIEFDAEVSSMTIYDTIGNILASSNLDEFIYYFDLSWGLNDLDYFEIVTVAGGANIISIKFSALNTPSSSSSSISSSSSSSTSSSSSKSSSSSRSSSSSSSSSSSISISASYSSSSSRSSSSKSSSSSSKSSSSSSSRSASSSSSSASLCLAGIEDFTTFTEVDPSGDITIERECVITVNTMRRDANAYVYNDYGPLAFGDLIHDFTASFTAGNVGSGFSPWALGNNGNWTTQDRWDNASGIEVRFLVTTGPEYRVYLCDWTDGTSNEAYYNFGNNPPGTKYYTISRSVDEASLWIYSDQARLTPIYKIHITGVTDPKAYRYLIVASSINDSGTSPTAAASGSIENLDLTGTSSSLSSSSSSSSLSSSSSSSRSSSSSSSLSSSSSSSLSSSSSSSLSSSSSSSSRSSSSTSSSSSSSLDCGGFEDLTTYTETDPNSDLTINPICTVTVDSMRRDVAANLIYNYGTNHFVSFQHELETAITAMNNEAILGVWAVTNSNYTLKDMDDAGEGIALWFYRTSGGVYQIWCQDLVNDNSDFYAFGSIPSSTLYLDIERNNTTFTVKIYTDEAKTSLLDTLSIVCDTTKYSTLCVSFSAEYAISGDRVASGYVRRILRGFDSSSSSSSSSSLSSSSSSSSNSSSSSSSNSSSSSSSNSSSSSFSNSSSSSSSRSSSSTSSSSSFSSP